MKSPGDSAGAPTGSEREGERSACSGQEDAGQGPRDVFISYVAEDAEIAKSLACGLEAVGYSTWYYQRDSVLSLRFTEQVMRALGRARAMVAVISLDAMSSDHVGLEFENASASKLPILVLLKGISHEEFRKRRQEWAYWVGTRVTLSVPPVQIERIVEGLKARGVSPGRGPEERGESSGEKIAAVSSSAWAVTASRSPRWGWRLGLATIAAVLIGGLTTWFWPAGKSTTPGSFVLRQVVTDGYGGIKATVCKTGPEPSFKYTFAWELETYDGRKYFYDGNSYYPKEMPKATGSGEVCLTTGSLNMQPLDAQGGFRIDYAAGRKVRLFLTRIHGCRLHATDEHECSLQTRETEGHPDFNTTCAPFNDRLEPFPPGEVEIRSGMSSKVASEQVGVVRVGDDSNGTARRDTPPKIPIVASKRWTIGSDGVVMDTKTGRQWSRAAPMMQPLEAVQRCDRLVLGGFDDWRLPKIQELRSLLSGC